MAFLPSLDIVGSALTAERYRTDVIMQNIANAKTTTTETGEPYRRKQVVFEERPLTFQETLDNAKSGGVRISQVVESDRDFKSVYDPTHPEADENGYVLYPNVDTTEEMVDLYAASNAYDANLSVFSLLKTSINKTLDMGK
ncbi:flagellar basal body rod protein FlgC [Scatolibacter rhodanostii]|uniref:flagellar basal body rod protein FlgC n=1 Tax=Scatolibacter rhodanostii TaxID=2014781 RepID=UPI000C08486E|nr:flagellar basal body rod protein FlgC [Scatolibacter rhodanostii]